MKLRIMSFIQAEFMLRIMNFIEAKFIERPHTTDLSAFERQ
jgi:hypothetical protein